MNDWYTDPNATLDFVWSRLARGTKDRHAATRHLTLATIGEDGPEQRTLVLRATDRTTNTIDLHTDIRTPKAAHLHADPRCALHTWDAKANLQIRLKGHAQILTGHKITHLWDRIPDPSRRAYGAEPRPGTPLTNGQTPIGHDQSAFAVLRITLTEIDTLHLGTAHHRFAFTAPDWHGTAIAP